LRLHAPVTGALLWGTYGSFRSTPALGFYASSAAISSAVAGATFFSVRECVVSPLLISTAPSKQYVRRQLELSGSDGDVSNAPLTYGDMRLHKVPDTVISGTFTGGVLSAWKLGPRRAFPGAITAGLVCGLLHLSMNEVKIQRVKYVSRQQQSLATQPEVVEVPKEPWPQRMLSALGFEKVTDEQYLQKLIKQRDAQLARIEELEREAQNGLTADSTPP